MNKIYPIILIIVATIFSFFNAFGVSLIMPSPALYAQIILLIFAIVIIVMLIKNKLNWWLLLIFSAIHVLIAIMQLLLDPAPILSVIEIILYITLLFLYKKA